MYPIKLNINPKGWRLFMRRKLDPRFHTFSQTILNRDAFTCQFCGLKVRKYQEIINLDQDYENNKNTNLVTACTFCAQCFFLESVGAGGYGGGVLVYLPEISQAHLNALCHLFFTAMHNETEYKEMVQNIYRHLKLRSQVIESEWGASMQEPATFGQMLIESEGMALLSSDLFQAIRLLPSRTEFMLQDIDWDMMLSSFSHK